MQVLLNFSEFMNHATMVESKGAAINVFGTILIMKEPSLLCISAGNLIRARRKLSWELSVWPLPSYYNRFDQTVEDKD